MQDCSYATRLGTKLLVLAATVLKNPSCHLFTNYNKPVQNNFNLGNATSAAPTFFPTKQVTPLGTFQDAGLLENDPVSTMVSEAKTLYPSSRTDLIVSLGTGTILDADFAQGAYTAQPRKASFRIQDLIWEKSRDKQVCQAFAHYPQYHCLDHEMDRDYALNNVNQMGKLLDRVKGDDSLTEPIDHLAHCAIASLFYFELSGMPCRRDGKYIGAGFILCSIPGVDPAFKSLLTRLASGRAQLYVNGQPISCTWDDGTHHDNHGNFCRRIKYETGDQIDITICMGGSTAPGAHISGLPSAIVDLASAQGLNACFGTSDHRKRKRVADDGVRIVKKKCLMMELDE
ncbi:uncharacterized protein PV06_04129 [Exophiala oligosperma]|uniref:Uncharacterized protein n=1 Tax=Exophiala oligosperma TaxID=215243 RepID=A0A0D2DRZ9_9EURO|nr:uncharacterized protein PV06_04129 [Exophiala oligosperma]KIW45773.1 hypothetical protein PV06_04129 [Exophiala oligosperma]